jgi:TRAP transporter TAXI family solute receptor
LIVLGLVILIGFFTGNVWAGDSPKPYEVVFQSTPFGTGGYTMGAALEMLFKKHNSWVTIKHQETAGATYTFKYMAINMKKIKSGEVNQVIGRGSGAIMGHVVEGRKPFDKIPIPEFVSLCAVPGYISLYGTFDPNIKTTRDLAGKRVGTGEKSRPFSGVLRDRPYFGKGLGIYDKIKWQPLGVAGSKDALLNGQIDAMLLNFIGRVEMADDGGLTCELMAPDPSTMQLMNSGRKLYLIPMDPEAIKKGYDFKKDIITHPILVKKGAVKGIDSDIYARGATGALAGLNSLPDDVLEEMIRVIYTHRDELGNYHASLKFFPKNPYPAGTPVEWIHPGVAKVLKNLNYPLPKHLQ